MSTVQPHDAGEDRRSWDVRRNAGQETAKPVSQRMEMKVSENPTRAPCGLRSCCGFLIARRDVDNCAKSICDALNGIAYLDDSQIIELTVRRAVDRERPRAVVRVEAAVLHDVDDMQRAGDCGHHLKRRRDRESRCDAPGRLTGRYHAAVAVGEAGD